MSAIRAACLYLGAVKAAWTEAFQPLDVWSVRTPAEFDRLVDSHNAEVARQRLVDREAEEEVSEPQQYTIAEAFALVDDAWDHRPPICGQHYPRPCECVEAHYHTGDQRPCWCDVTIPDPAATSTPSPDRFPFSQGRSCGVKQANSWAACTRPAGHEGAHMNGGISFTVPEATSAAGVEHPVPAAEGTTPGEYAAVAVREVLAEHAWLGRSGVCACGTRADEAYDYREHVSAEIARRIDASVGATPTPGFAGCLTGETGDPADCTCEAAEQAARDRLDGVSRGFIHWFQQ